MEEEKKVAEAPIETKMDAKDNYDEVANIVADEVDSDETAKEEEPVITFEERWMQLLDNCKQKLSNLDDNDKDGQVRDLWTSINKFVTIMAVPKEILPKARKTLLKMAGKSSFTQALTLIFYTLLTFLPRKAYRSWNAQQYFKKRLTRDKNK